MLNRRIAVVSHSKTLQHEALTGLMATGATVELFKAKEELISSRGEYNLIVVHFEEIGEDTLTNFKTMLGKLMSNGKAVAVIPKADLETHIRLLAHPQCNNVLVESVVDSAKLAGIAVRHLYGDIFGLEKYLPWGIRVYSMLVGNYDEKSVAIATISDFASSLGIRNKYLEHIEKVVDELLMNALYDAPVDAEGQGLLDDVSSKNRIEMKLEQKAIIQYGCDGNHFAVSIRDNYGSLKKEVVLDYLDKCLHSDKKINRTEGGAGLGLYIVTNSVSEYVLNIHPGKAAEVICLFDLKTPGILLKSFGVFEEKIDILGQVHPTTTKSAVSEPAVSDRSQAPMPVSLKAALGVAIVLLLAASGILLWKDLRPTKKGTLVIKTNPPGAKIRVDGTLRGTTDAAAGLIIDSLEVNRPHVLRATKKGYKDFQAVVRVSHKKHTTHDLKLEPLPIELPVSSKPEGAEIHINEKNTGKTTPAVVELVPNRKYKLVITLDDYEKFTKEFTTGGPDEKQELELVKLKPTADWGSLRIISQPSKARVFLDGVMQRGHTPFENVAIQADRDVMLELRMEGYVPFKQQIRLAPQEKQTIKATLQRGGLLSIETSPPTQVIIGDREPLKTPVKDLPLPTGSHNIEVRSRWPSISHNFTVNISSQKETEKKIIFGTVAAATGFRLQRNGRTTQRLGLIPGKHSVTLVSNETGKSHTMRVEVKPGHTTVADPDAKK